MNWYNELEKILKDNISDKCIDYLYDILCKGIDLEEFLKIFKKWESELRVWFKYYQLEGVYGWSMYLEINEFVYTQNFDDNFSEYLIKIILLDYFYNDFYTFSKDKNYDLSMMFRIFHEEKTNFKNRMNFFDDIESYEHIDEDTFLSEITEYVNKSYKKFKKLNQGYPAREKYSLNIEPQYKKFNDFLSSLLNSIKEKKIFAKINELGNENDATVRYFLKTHDRVYTIRVEDFM